MKNEKRKAKKKDSSQFTAHSSQEEQSERLNDKRLKTNDRTVELEDLLKRVQADFVNYKTRNEEARIGLIKNAGKETILKVLPVLDNMERALKHVPEKLADDEWVKGMINIKDQLANILREQGLSEIKSVGETFDHNLHEAISFVESDDKDGIVLEEYEKGYVMNGQVVRVARVVVGKAPNDK